MIFKLILLVSISILQGREVTMDDEDLQIKMLQWYNNELSKF